MFHFFQVPVQHVFECCFSKLFAGDYIQGGGRMALAPQLGLIRLFPWRMPNGHHDFGGKVNITLQSFPTVSVLFSRIFNIQMSPVP